MILKEVLWTPKDKIKDVEALKEKLTVHPKAGIDNVEPIETFKETDDYLGVPRNFFNDVQPERDERAIGKPTNIEFYGELRQNQKQIISDWQDLYNQGHTDWIINASMGSGKTIIGIYIASMLQVPFLVIVPLEKLMGQWMTQIVNFTNIPNGKIGKIQQARCNYQGTAACVGMIHSLAKDKYPEGFKNHFGLVIWDECHVCGAQTFSETTKMFPAKYRLSASGTLSRGDGLENVFYYNLGKNVVKEQEQEQPKPTVCVYEYKKSSGKLPMWATDKLQVRAKTISNVAANTERNKLIAYFANTLANKDIRTLVVSERIKQLQELEQILYLDYGQEDMGIYISSTREYRKNWLLEHGKILLATSKIINVGIDSPSLRGLIFATPIADVRQLIGRIQRKCPGVADPVVVDIVDTAYPQAIGWSKKRRKYYDAQGFPIKYIEKVGG